MPEDAITIDTAVQTVRTTQPTFDRICILGYSDSGDASEGELISISTPAEAEDYFGEDSTLCNEIIAAMEQGIDYLYGMKVPIEEDETEEVGTSVTTLSYPPTYLSETLPSIGSDDVVATYESGDDIDSPSAGEVVINFYTGEAIAETTGDLTYDYVDWDAVQSALENEDEIGIISLAGIMKAEELVSDVSTTDAYGISDAYDYGDIGNLIDILGGLNSVTVIPKYGMVDGDIDTSHILSHTGNVEQYQTRNVMMVAHLLSVDTYDINGMLAGAVARVPKIDKIMWKRIRNIDETDGYWTSGQINTLEDSQVNAITQILNQYVFSNGLSGADDTTYKWLDIVRTQYFIESLLREKLTKLVKNTNLPYTSDGIATVKGAILDTLAGAVDTGAIVSEYVDSNGEVQRGYTVSMPKIENISSSDKENRLLDNISITAKLAGHIQEITINLSLLL